MRRLVAIHVLAAPVREAVVIADKVLDRVGPQPIVHVHQRFQLASIICTQTGKVCPIHEREKVGIIAGRSLHCAFGECPTVTRKLLLAAGRGEFLERGAVG